MRPNDSPWYTSHLRLMKRNVQRLFHKFKRVKSTANWESYKKLRNDYQQALDQAESDYKNSLTNSLVDSKNSKFCGVQLKVCSGKDHSGPSLL